MYRTSGQWTSGWLILEKRHDMRRIVVSVQVYKYRERKWDGFVLGKGVVEDGRWKEETQSIPWTCFSCCIVVTNAHCACMLENTPSTTVVTTTNSTPTSWCWPIIIFHYGSMAVHHRSSRSLPPRTFMEIASTWGVNYEPSYRVTLALEISPTQASLANIRSNSPFPLPFNPAKVVLRSACASASGQE